MSVKIVNECCDCAVPGYPCLGSACPRRNVEVYECDECGEELVEDVYEDEDGKHYCKDCLLKKFKKVFVCEKCGEEIEDGEIYEDDGDIICEDCLLRRYEKSF